MKQLHRKKTGIIGGTFNPIHMGHLRLAEMARDLFQLDEVLFMPSGNSYMKNASEILSGSVRLQLVQAAISQNPFFKASSLELEREGNTYTYETLQQLKAIEPDTDFFFIVGGDSLMHIEHWKHPELIFDHCTLIAAIRQDIDGKLLQDKIEELTQRYHAQILLLPMERLDISSTQIRNRLKEQKSVRYLMPEKEYNLIKELQLYQ